MIDWLSAIIQRFEATNATESDLLANKSVLIRNFEAFRACRCGPLETQKEARRNAC